MTRFNRFSRFHPLHYLRRLIAAEVASALAVATTAQLYAIRKEMTNVTDQVRADLDAIKGATAGIQAGITGLQQQIADLQAKASSGGTVTADELAELHSDATDLAAIAAGLPSAAPASTTDTGAGTASATGSESAGT